MGAGGETEGEQGTEEERKGVTERGVRDGGMEDGGTDGGSEGARERGRDGLAD